MTTIKFYKNEVRDFDINSGKLSEDARQADCVIGVSIGALAVLKDLNQLKGKVVLINPPLPKRSIFVWIFQWVKYIVGGLFIEHQKFTLNPIRWVVEISRAVSLFRIDFSNILREFPKDRLTVIRSRDDKYFCDLKALDFLRSLGVKVVEIVGGHNWNLNTEEAMNKLIEH